MEWLALAAVFLLVIAFAWGLLSENRQRKAMSEEEWENRERQPIGTLGAGMMGLHQILQADMKKAAAVQEDARQGMLPSAAQEDNRAEKEEGE